MRNYLLIFSLLFFSITFAQNTITGLVTDGNNQPIPGANIQIQGDKAGTITDVDGKFNLKSSKKPPYTIEVASLGHESKKVYITSNNQNVDVVLTGAETKLNEVVISASRAPERIMESPVTIERMSLKDIKSTASPSYYDGLENLKEVQMNTSSLTFKSINTRGFATVSNTRFMQLVDGMDNSSPLLNFVLGNMIGVSEIDVQSVELLPGASSALYGANAFNGIMFMNSKSPFIYQGISTYLKYGSTSQKAAGTNEYYDYGIRMAHAFNNYFAAKVNMTFMKGTDWFATNYDDKTRAGITRSDKSYDGINVYGDDLPINLGTYAPASLLAAIPSLNTTVSRTGYNETDLTNNKAANTKIDFSLHLRPFGNEKTEVIWQSKFGYGNAIYQGANRYNLNNFFMQQHKLEIKGKNFFVRGYTTTEDGGKSYDMQFTGININRAWKSDAAWVGDYITNYAGAYSGVVPGLAPGNITASHAFARSRADVGRFLPGTAAFQNAFNQVIAEPSVLKGSRLVDNSRIYHSDANYNLKDIIKFGEIQVGGSYREYQLNSNGRIYTDANGPIIYNEYGFYTQLQKKFMDDKFKFTGSVRYDKAKNFDGNYSPRVSLVYSAGEKRQHNLRASFQTGFRNPTTQDQYIGFDVGYAALVGSAPDNLTRFSEVKTVSNGSPAVGQMYAGGGPTTPVTSVTMNGINAYQNSYTYTSVLAFGAFAATNPGNTPGAAALLKKTNVGLVKPEEVKAYELGYRSQINEINIDLNGYYNIYNNFIGNTTVIAPLYGTASETFNFATGAPTYFTNPAVQTLHALANNNYRVYQLYTNTALEIHSLGIGIGLSKKMFGNYDIGISYNYAQFDFDQAKDPGFEAGFNTPKHRVKASLGNESLFENFGFNASIRWNNEYLWQSTMADGMIAAATVVDAQINYGLPKLKSVIKAGATNIAGKEYTQVLGAGAIGQQYFVSWTINP